MLDFINCFIYQFIFSFKITHKKIESYCLYFVGVWLMVSITSAVLWEPHLPLQLWLSGSTGLIHCCIPNLSLGHVVAKHCGWPHHSLTKCFKNCKQNQLNAPSFPFRWWMWLRPSSVLSETLMLMERHMHLLGKWANLLAKLACCNVFMPESSTNIEMFKSSNL